MISRFEKFICSLTEIDLYWHRLASNEMKPYGLKGNYAIYFIKLHNQPQGMTAAQLAVACGKDKADISRDMSALEKAGLIRRERRDGSAYRAMLLLTEQGEQLTDEIIRKAELAVSCIGGSLTDEERSVFYRALDEITNNLQELSETGLPDAKE